MNPGEMIRDTDGVGLGARHSWRTMLCLATSSTGPLKRTVR